MNLFVLFSQDVSLLDLSNCDSKIFSEGSEETNKKQNKKVGQQASSARKVAAIKPYDMFDPSDPHE